MSANVRQGIRSGADPFLDESKLVIRSWPSLHKGSKCV